MPQTISISFKPVLEAFQKVENAEAKPTCASCGIDFMSVYHAVYNLVTHGQAEAVYNGLFFSFNEFIERGRAVTVPQLRTCSEMHYRVLQSR